MGKKYCYMSSFIELMTAMLFCLPSKAASIETFIRYDLKTGKTERITVMGDPFSKENISEKEDGEVVKLPELLNRANTRSGMVGDGTQKRVTNTRQPSVKWIGQIYSTDYISSTDSFERILGSGALVSPNHVLTAAHVVFRKDKRKPWDNIHFYPGAAGSSVPYGTIAAAVYVPESYQTESLSKVAVVHDFAVVELLKPTSFPENYGYYDLWVSPQIESFNPNVLTPFCTANLAGYPDQEAAEGYLYKTTGLVSIWKKYVLQYEMLTLPGQSGGPIYKTFQDGSFKIIGIICNNVFGEDGSYRCSRGRGITPTVKKFVEQCVKR